MIATDATVGSEHPKIPTFAGMTMGLEFPLVPMLRVGMHTPGLCPGRQYNPAQIPMHRP